MAQQNRWGVGKMYYDGKLNGVPFFTQPGGPRTKVYPSERNGSEWEEYPIPGLVISEWTPWVNPPCQHAVKEFCIIREFDYETGKSCALLTCPTCSCVSRAVEPYEAIFDPNLYAVIVA